MFRGKFLDRLKQSRARGELAFHGGLAELVPDGAFERLLDQIVRQEWVVYARPPFGGPKQVLKYLARYTHRVAISNQRLIALDNDQVTFRWKDYANGSRQSLMTLTAVEFLRRFLLHVLPRGFVKIRHYGFMANRFRQDKLELCRRLLNVTQEPPAAAPSVIVSADKTPSASASETACRRCPQCRDGHLWIVERLRPLIGPAATSRPVPMSPNTS